MRKIKPVQFYSPFILTLFIALIFFISLTGTPAEAHSSLQKTYPQASESLDKPPSKIELWFEDPVVIHNESIKVINPQGNTVQKGKPFVDSKDRRHVIIFLEDNLTPGKYTVHMNVVALDGYVVRDQFEFTLREPSSESGKYVEFKLVKSSPSDGEITTGTPQKIDLWFTQPAELSLLGLFRGENSFRMKEPYIDPNDPNHVIVELDDELLPGTYQVTWFATPIEKTDNTIADYQGIFYFAVDEVSSLESTQNRTNIQWFSGSIGLKHIAYWLAFIGMLTLLGGTWFSLAISKGTGYMKRWIQTSTFLFGLSAFGLILLFMERRWELSNLSFADFLSLQFSWIPIVQLLLVAIGWIIPGKPRLILLTLAILLWPFSSGHSTYPRYGGYFSIGLNMLHLLGISVWMGGLLALILMIPREDALSWLKRKGKTYSKWAFWSMVVIILTGIGMTLNFIPSFSWGSLMLSDWGKALVFKVLLVITLVGLGFWQRRYLLSKTLTGFTSFIRRGKIELIYAGLILFAAAFMIDSQPSAADQGVYPKTMVKENVEISVDISPFRMGSNDVIIRFQNQPEWERVNVDFFMPPDWRKKNKAFALGNGTYKVSGNFLHASGTMYMEVEAVKPNGETVVFPFRVVVPGEVRLYE